MKFQKIYTYDNNTFIRWKSNNPSVWEMIYGEVIIKQWIKLQWLRHLELLFERIHMY